MWLVLGALVSVAIIASGQNEPPQVTISQGEVIGSRAADGNYYEFYGIPYAGSTSGRHRFKAPSPPPSFNEAFTANQKNIGCVRALGSGYEGTEDCLVANIFTPSLDNGRNLSVMVWIKGKEFDIVYEQERTFKKFMEQDVVVVSLNFRESIFGFLCLGTEEAPGNAGLKDIIAGLRWVQENIVVFGGNPNDITLFGHGSGAAAVDLITFSPMAEGLVHKAILQSGNALAPWSVSRDNLEYAVQVAEALGHIIDTTTTIQTLSEVFTRTTVAALMAVINDLDLTDNSLAFASCIENPNLENGSPLFIKSPYESIRDGDLLQIPFMIGFVDYEGIIRAEEAIRSDWIEKMESSFRDFMQPDLKFITEDQEIEISQKIRNFYFTDVTNIDMNQYLKYHGDTTIIVSAIRETHLRASISTKPIYLYQFSYKGELGEQFVGPSVADSASHTEELAYLFYKELDENISPTDYALGDIIVERWTNFAKTGDPTSESSQVPWLQFTVNNPNYLRFIYDEASFDEATLEKDLIAPHAETIDFWNLIYDEHFRDAQGIWELTHDYDDDDDNKEDDEDEEDGDGESDENGEESDGENDENGEDNDDESDENGQDDDGESDENGEDGRESDEDGESDENGEDNDSVSDENGEDNDNESDENSEDDDGESDEEGENDDGESDENGEDDDGESGDNGEDDDGESDENGEDDDRESDENSEDGKESDEDGESDENGEDNDSVSDENGEDNDNESDENSEDDDGESDDNGEEDDGESDENGEDDDGESDENGEDDDGESDEIGEDGKESDEDGESDENGEDNDSVSDENGEDNDNESDENSEDDDGESDENGEDDDGESEENGDDGEESDEDGEGDDDVSDEDDESDENGEDDDAESNENGEDDDDTDSESDENGEDEDEDNGDQTELPQVSITQGDVIGSKAADGSYFEFYGIPYADSTSGIHRFKAPSAAPTFSKPFTANKKNIRCIRALSMGYDGTEDCLVANIFTPTLDRNSMLSVMVWIKGKEFDTVYEQERTFKQFMEHDVVVVTLNFRESIFGFLCLGTETAPGNAGLKDIIAGLRWIQDNIAAFGGDPNDITLFGHGSGAAAVDLITFSPMAEGLVHKAISQSGNALAPWAVSRDNLEYAVQVADALGHTNVTIEILSEVFTRTSVEILMAAINGLDLTDNSLAFAPCLENPNLENGDPFFIKSPYESIEDGDFLQIPFMIGFVDYEGTIRAEKAIGSDWIEKMESSFTDFIQPDLKFDTEDQKNEISESIKKFYFTDVTNIDINQYLKYHGETMIVVSSIREARLRSSISNEPMYLYQFSYKGELGEQFVGPVVVDSAAHSEELAYLFYEKSNTNVQPRDSAVGDILVERWTNFAKTGNPTSGSSLVEWSPFTVDDPNFIRILDADEVSYDDGANLEISVKDPYPNIINFWNPIYDEHFLDAKGRWSLTVRDEDEDDDDEEGDDNGEDDNGESDENEEDDEGDENGDDCDEDDDECESDSASTAIGYTFLILSLFGVLNQFHSQMLL